MLSDRCLSCLSVTLAYCGQTVEWIKMKLGMHGGLALATLCYIGTQLLSLKRGRSPQFLAHICSVQTAGWIKMQLGREVGLSPSDIVLDYDPAPLPKKGAELPIFCLYLLLSNGCMDQNATWMEVGLSPGELC